MLGTPHASHTSKERGLTEDPEFKSASGSVVVRAPDGELHTLLHGDVIGRLWSASLHLNDGRVSECHAMISSRGTEMQLLGLRGRFRLDGTVRREVDLVVGQRVELAPHVWLEVVEVHKPTEVLAIEAAGLLGVVVTGVVSLTGGERGALRPGWHPDAPCQLWPTGDGWMRTGPNGPEPVLHGSAWVVDGITFRAALQADGGVMPTEDDRLSERLRIVSRYDSVHIQVLPNAGVLVLSGLSARLIAELVTVGQPLTWDALAAELWGPLPQQVLRKRWDMQLSRLRNKFRAVGIRSNLVVADGTGLVQLVLGPADEVVDES